MKHSRPIPVRKLTMIAMLSCVSFLLMLLNFSVPVMPGFIKMDLGELPALIGSFALGPVSGAVICLIKNLLHLTVSSTGGVGELSNFILGVLFVVPAGLIYTRWKTRKGPILGALVGALCMAAVSVLTNYFIVYPFYAKFMIPMEGIIGAYSAIASWADTLWEALVCFNMPFTFVKGLLSMVITLLVYKRLSPFIKGTRAKIDAQARK
jgi:riboflavin transporter FmnP